MKTWSCISRNRGNRSNPDGKTLIVVFHSYPSKPCIDGLLATFFATYNYEDHKIKLVPYWRTKQSFERLKNTVESCNQANTEILYLDCAPDLEEEVNYLLSIVINVKIDVLDHHPRKKDSPIERLITNDVNFKCQIDEANCGATLMFNVLKEKLQKKFALLGGDLLRLVHFSDYEGVDDARSGKPDAERIASAAFRVAINNAESEKARSNLRGIQESGMALYYILDLIMADKEDWKFLYGVDGGEDDDEIFENFEKQRGIYLEHAVNCVSGQKASVYSEEKSTEYLGLMHDLKQKLTTGDVLKSRSVGGRTADIFVCHVDIQKYGRSLEPYIQTKLRDDKINYAVLMNNPSENKQKELSYYFSLRRDNQGDHDFDARKLADYLKQVSGSVIGGGHPWASGLSLNTKQHNQFFTKEKLQL